MIGRTIPSRFVLAVGLAFALALSSRPALHAQPIISTLPDWDGVTAAPLLSRDFTSSSFGQTFTTPNDASALNSISLFLGYSPLFFPFDQDLRFHAYLFSWNGSTVTDLLWRSPVQNGATEIELSAQTIDAGSVPLAAGGEYAVVLSTLEADPFDPDLAFITMFPAYQNVGLVDFDAYTGGALIQSFADNWDGLLASPWFVDESTDLAIELQFAPRVDVVVPEPSTFVLLACALLLCAVPVTRRASRLTSADEV